MTLAERNPLADFRPTPWPEDFGGWLEGLKVLAGVNWQEMARLLGVTDRAILLWRRGERRPSGANILAITELARRIPGGIEVLCQGDAWALTLWVTDEECGGGSVG
jgi:transcriptional regulator with XRE-family HTH domain